jgi:hypothetical protein
MLHDDQIDVAIDLRDFAVDTAADAAAYAVFEEYYGFIVRFLKERFEPLDRIESYKICCH